MGKKRIVKKGDSAKDGAKHAAGKKLARKRLDVGVLHVQSTYNNTKLLLADVNGDAITWSSSGALGFKGAKKGTPFAAAKIGELLGESAKTLGLKSVDVVVKGVGAGRESAIRGFMSTSGVSITSIQDRTAVPFNGPKPPKPRRV
jgi:small subunit ribosomal protein S11